MSVFSLKRGSSGSGLLMGNKHWCPLLLWKCREALHDGVSTLGGVHVQADKMIRRHDHQPPALFQCTSVTGTW